jgi:AraC-like DNA-binding protein
MDLIISYVGFSQTIFAIYLMFTKSPLKIADVILAVLLAVFALMFGLDILHNYNIIESNRWAISLSLAMMYAPLLYLYSKYVTKKYEKFDLRDYLHAIPSVLLILIFLIIRILPSNNSIPIESFYVQFSWLRNIFGYIFILLLIIYIINALSIVIRFKRHIMNYYSFKSYKISLNWLLTVIISFVLILLLIVISSTLFESHKINVEVYLFRHIIELFYVYILSIWGFSQNQLNHDLISGSNVDEIENSDSSLEKYHKSGLKKDLAKNYLQKLIQFMEENEAWKDQELSIAKLSYQTSIPKHHISEVLNEYLGKNFYIFVNEYRVEYAKVLLTSKKYNNWSILAIGYECGFNSKTAFNNFFKKHTQVTPSEYKKSENNKS